MGMRVQRKVGGYLDTEEKVVEFFRALNGERKHDMEVGRQFGLNGHQTDTLRLVFNKVAYHTSYIPEETIEKVCEMYKAGDSLKSIQQTMGMSMSNVYYILNTRVERDRHTFWTPIKEKRLVYMKEVQKCKWKDIGAALGRSINACAEKYKQIKRKREKETA